MTHEKENLRHKAHQKASPAQADVAGQYGDTHASPNPSGVVSAHPFVLSGDGDATSGNGHGRDRDGSQEANTKSGTKRGQSTDDLPFAGTPGGAKQ